MVDKVPGRVAQVFVWKQESAPDVEYARQVLSVASPEAYQAVSNGAPLLQLFSVMGEWSEDPWERSLRDMRAIPAPEGTRWTDSARYLLKGWQGTDSRTGDKIFVVVVYYRSLSVPETFRGEAIDTPAYGAPAGQQAQPYYQPYPTGPMAWPQPPPGYTYPQYPGQGPGQGSTYGQQAQPGYPYGYNSMATGPLGSSSNLPMVVPPPEMVLQDSYAPFYAGFGTRLAAMLIDVFFMSWFFAAVMVVSLVALGLSGQPGDVFSWFRSYTLLYVLLGLVVFVTYLLIGWSTSGRTWGKKLMGIRVVRADGGTPGFGRALLRMLGYLFSLSIAGWGFMMILLDSRRQGLHDKIAETFVVPDRPAAPVPAGLPGYRMVSGALPSPASQGPPPMRYTPAEAAPGPRGSPAHAGQAAPPYGPPQVAPATGVQTSATRVPAQPPAPAQEAEGQRQKAEGGEEAGGPAPGGDASAAARQEPYGPEHVQEGVQIEMAEPYIAPSLITGPLSSGPLGQSAEAVLAQAARERPERPPDVERASSLFKSGTDALEQGVRRGYTGMEVELGAATTAAGYFREALQLVPNALLYRYFYAVALRYSEGFEAAIGEFRHVLELDPGHFEARQQVAFGPRWHDAYAYPAWAERAVDVNMPLPEPVRSLLPQPHRPGTRLVLLREGTNKTVMALSRTRRDTWSELPTGDMPARIELVLTRTPAGQSSPSTW